MNTPSLAPIGKRYRISSESVWPLRDTNGMTFAERKRHMLAKHIARDTQA